MIGGCTARRPSASWPPTERHRPQRDKKMSSEDITKGIQSRRSRRDRRTRPFPLQPSCLLLQTASLPRLTRVRPSDTVDKKRSFSSPWRQHLVILYSYLSLLVDASQRITIYYILHGRILLFVLERSAADRQQRRCPERPPPSRARPLRMTCWIQKATDNPASVTR